MLAILLTSGGVLALWFSHLDGEAYPAEPEKRRALELCSREDPTFLRFLASNRDNCYRHVSARDVPLEMISERRR